MWGYIKIEYNVVEEDEEVNANLVLLFYCLVFTKIWPFKIGFYELKMLMLCGMDFE